MNQQQFESSEQRLDADAVKRVIDRAAALQKAHLETVSPDQLEALASELGISPEFVQRALNETDATVMAAAPQVVTVRRKIVRKKPALAALSAKDIRTALTPGILYAIFAGIAVTGSHSNNGNIEVVMLMAQPAILTAYFGSRQPHRRMGALVGLSFGLLPILMASVTNDRSVPGYVGFFYGAVLAALGFGATAAKFWWQERQETEVVEEIVTEPAR